MAAYNSHTGVVILLLDAGASVDKADEVSWVCVRACVCVCAVCGDAHARHRMHVHAPTDVPLACCVCTCTAREHASLLRCLQRPRGHGDPAAGRRRVGGQGEQRELGAVCRVARYGIRYEYDTEYGFQMGEYGGEYGQRCKRLV
jgi:hypothetical protein